MSACYYSIVFCRDPVKNRIADYFAAHVPVQLLRVESSSVIRFEEDLPESRDIFGHCVYNPSSCPKVGGGSAILKKSYDKIGEKHQVCFLEKPGLTGLEDPLPSAQLIFGYADKPGKNKRGPFPVPYSGRFSGILARSEYEGT